MTDDPKPLTENYDVPTENTSFEEGSIAFMRTDCDGTITAWLDQGEYVLRFGIKRLLATIAERDATIRALEEGRDDGLTVDGMVKRRDDILEWLHERIGTAWECNNCGYSTYHQESFECAECGTEMPIEHVLAFKLGALMPDPSGSEPSNRACVRPSTSQEDRT